MFCFNQKNWYKQLRKLILFNWINLFFGQKEKMGSKYEEAIAGLTKLLR